MAGICIQRANPLGTSDRTLSLHGTIPVQPVNAKDCIRHLHPYAMRTDKGFMLAEEMLSWLHNNNVIFPSVEVIERTLAEVVTLANRSVFSTLTAQLEKQHKSALDSLLISEGEQPSRLAWLLQPPGKINGKMCCNISTGLIPSLRWGCLMVLHFPFTRTGCLNWRVRAGK